MVDLKKELDSYQIILSIMSNEYYNESIINMLKQLENGKICYVSLNKTSESLIKTFRSSRINTKNIFFIDAVSRSVGPEKECDSSILISSPYALTELGIAISEILKTGKFDIVVFDSLSTLSIYQKEKKDAAAKFASHIINKIRSNDNKGVFTCLENDANSELIKESSMFVDKVVKMSHIKEEMKGRAAKNVAVAAFAVIGLAALSLFLKPGSPTAMAVGSPDSGIGSALGSAYATLLIFSLLGAAVFLMYRLGRNKEERIIPPAKPAKINSSRVRKEFKHKIMKWLEAHAYFF